MSEGESNSSTICEETTNEQIKSFEEKWKICRENVSLCSKIEAKIYLETISSFSELKIYFVWQKEIFDVKTRLKTDETFSFDWKFDKSGKEKFLVETIRSDSIYLTLTVGLYLISLLLMVKNIFFFLMVVLNFCFSLIWSSIIFLGVFQLPLTILNFSSLTTLVFVLFLDGVLWLKCWNATDHRRHDCTMQRKIENLLTQTFYFSLPKNFVSILILIISFNTRIIALQSFNVFTALLLFHSFILSFTLYPGKQKRFSL